MWYSDAKRVNWKNGIARSRWLCGRLGLVCIGDEDDSSWWGGWEDLDAFEVCDAPSTTAVIN